MRTLDVLPANDPHHADYRTVFLQMSAALLSLQRTDCFWNPSLVDPTDFGGKETSGTAMFTYGMAWGIRQGLLPADVYLPVVTKAWNAMVTDALHPSGFLGWMQGTCDKVPNFEDYGLGCFLLAGAEVYRLAEQPPATAKVTAGTTSASPPPRPVRPRPPTAGKSPLTAAPPGSPSPTTPPTPAPPRARSPSPAPRPRSTTTNTATSPPPRPA